MLVRGADRDLDRQIRQNRQMQQKNALDEQRQQDQMINAPQKRVRGQRLGDEEYEEFERLAQQRFQRTLLERIRRDEKMVSHFDLREAEEIAKNDPVFAAQLQEARGAKSKAPAPVTKEDVVPEKATKFQQLMQKRVAQEQQGGYVPSNEAVEEAPVRQDPVSQRGASQPAQFGLSPTLGFGQPQAQLSPSSAPGPAFPYAQAPGPIPDATAQLMESSPLQFQNQMTSQMIAMMQEMQRQQQSIAQFQDQQKNAQIQELQSELHRMQMRMLAQEQQNSQKELESELGRLRKAPEAPEKSGAYQQSAYTPSSQGAAGRPLLFQTRSGMTQDALEARNQQRRRILDLLEKEFPQ